MLKVLIVDYDKLRSKPLKQSLIDSGFDVVAHVENDVALHAKCLALKPDVVIIDTDSPNRDTLENICVMSMHDPRPIVIFTHDGNEAVLLSNRIVMMTNGTHGKIGAGIGDILTVDLVKPRDRLALAENQDYNHLRSEVLRFLYERHAKK